MKSVLRSIPLWYWVLLFATMALVVFFCLIVFNMSVLIGRNLEEMRLIRLRQDQIATATARAIADVTATALAEVQATAIAASDWSIVLSESFDGNENGWPFGEVNTELGTINRSIRDGKYQFELRANRSLHQGAGPILQPVSNFYLTVEAQMLSGPESGNYGLIFRLIDNDNFYYFAIYETNELRFVAFEKGEWADLLPPTGSVPVKPREVNRLTVIAEGDHFMFFVNDQFVGEAYNSRFAQGLVGVGVGLHTLGAEATFQFDNFTLRAEET